MISILQPLFLNYKYPKLTLLLPFEYQIFVLYLLNKLYELVSAIIFISQISHPTPITVTKRTRSRIAKRRGCGIRRVNRPRYKRRAFARH